MDNDNENEYSYTKHVVSSIVIAFGSHLAIKIIDFGIHIIRKKIRSVKEEPKAPSPTKKDLGDELYKAYQVKEQARQIMEK